MEMTIFIVMTMVTIILVMKMTSVMIMMVAIIGIAMPRR